MTCRPYSASGASLARSRARTPRSRSCGRRSVGTGKAAHVGRPAGYPAALAGQQTGRYGAVRGLSRCSQLGWRWQRAHSGGSGGSPWAARASGASRVRLTPNTVRPNGSPSGRFVRAAMREASWVGNPSGRSLSDAFSAWIAIGRTISGMTMSSWHAPHTQHCA